ncbi:MAG: hypothetical protein AUI15_00835 [Actinobacteria bacterium 13_2_20CM_2_66_6]|nr:MAG: hypothetical protein AUI15_00835 [Actinobacteria bacterium 13_2_20CM_2_66_6]
MGGPLRRFQSLLIAGGAGFIGSNFIRLLRATRPEVDVVVLDKLTYAGNLANLAEFEGKPGYRFVHGDICDRNLIDSLAQHVDAIVNFAAETHVDRSLLDPFAFIDTDVRGTAVLCEAARKHGHEVFLLVSTDEVYGNVPEGRSRESDPLAPRSPYSASKAGGEHIARAYAASFGLPLLITRGSNNYGPHQYPEKLVPVLITNAIDDLKLPSGRQVAEAVLDIMKKPRSLIEFVADRPGHDYRYALDIAHITELGWEPRVGFAEGLERSVRWDQENQQWWRPLKSGDYWEFYKKNYRPLGK